ncbi:MAG: hypothetical protein K0R21_1577 [Anaerocolumna sp.]|jgi:hypothetical protein|nr:hypothetical protein [Anaerocolumna sp.]
MKSNQKGSITVFLSLIMLLILAVIMTTIESARISTAKTLINRSLITAMDSVMAEYYRPLFDNYHLFALDGSYGTGTIQETMITDKVEEYLNYSFYPEENIRFMDYQISLEDFNPMEIDVDSTRMNQYSSLMDNRSGLFYSQIISYMKYKELGNGLEYFLNKTSLLRETGETRVILEEKLKTEEALYQMDQKILQLMKVIDGINIDGSGVTLNSVGMIKVEEFFVKMIKNETAPANMGINHPLVYASLNTQYVDVNEEIDSIVTNLNNLIQTIYNEDMAKNNYEQLSLVDTSRLQGEERLEHERNKQAVQEELDKFSESKVALTATITDNINSLKTMIAGIQNQIGKAYPLLDMLMIEQKSVSVLMEHYETLLDSNKDKIGSNFYQGLLNDYESIAHYKNSESDENYNFKTMKETLIHNEIVLTNAYENIDVAITPEETELKEVIASILKVKDIFSQYNYEKLIFDYSTLTIPGEKEDLFQAFQNLLKEGITGLVLEDTDVISEKKLISTDIPSRIYQDAENSKTDETGGNLEALAAGEEMHKEESENDRNIKDTLTNTSFHSGVGLFIDILGSFGNEMQAFDVLKEVSESITGQIMLLDYLKEHFHNYSKEAETDLEIPDTALNYEAEYILEGNSSDYDNLAEFIMRVLMLRTIMNVITLMSDTSKSKEAQLLAAGVVGFSGLPALVSMAKMVIIIFWAFAEALVDTAALLKGKTLPIIKKGSEVQFGLIELTTISAALIQSKAENLKNETLSLSANYIDYIRFYLFLSNPVKLNYRSMDLIQENIQLNYDDKFYINNCITGFQMNSELRMQQKFASIPFVRQIIGSDHGEFKFYITKEYSY